MSVIQAEREQLQQQGPAPSGYPPVPVPVPGAEGGEMQRLMAELEHKERDRQEVCGAVGGAWLSGLAGSRGACGVCVCVCVCFSVLLVFLIVFVCVCVCVSVVGGGGGLGVAPTLVSGISVGINFVRVT